MDSLGLKEKRPPPKVSALALAEVVPECERATL